MAPITGGICGFGLGTCLGWMSMGTGPGAIGLGCAVAACAFGLMSVFAGRGEG